MVATRIKLAGKVTFSLVLEIVICRSSSGWRRDSRTWRENSGNSSRKRTPWCASEISPGTMGVPPPIIAQLELLWWGVRKGREIDLRGSWDSSLILAISNISNGEGADNREGIALASIVLPLPGGPVRRRL